MWSIFRIADWFCAVNAPPPFKGAAFLAPGGPRRVGQTNGGNVMIQSLETVWAPRVLSIARIVSALIFMAHGTQKHLNFPLRANNAPGPELFSLYGVAGALEIVGGILLLFGLFTRPVAFLLSGEMAIAYWYSHAPRNMIPLLNGGDAPILYCFFFLYLACAGGGAWSLDRLIWKKE
jgi:putative oxidoreductase